MTDNRSLHENHHSPFPARLRCWLRRSHPAALPAHRVRRVAPDACGRGYVLSLRVCALAHVLPGPRGPRRHRVPLSADFCRLGCLRRRDAVAASLALRTSRIVALDKLASGFTRLRSRFHCLYAPCRLAHDEQLGLVFWIVYERAHRPALDQTQGHHVPGRWMLRMRVINLRSAQLKGRDVTGHQPVVLLSVLLLRFLCPGALRRSGLPLHGADFAGAVSPYPWAQPAFFLNAFVRLNEAFV